MTKDILKRCNLKLIPMDRWKAEAHKRRMTVSELIRNSVEHAIKNKVKF